MKLTAIALVVALLCIVPRVYSQKVTLNEKNVPLQKVLDEIKKQTGYSFWMKGSVLDMKKRVTVEVKDMGLVEVLERVFKGEKVEFRVEGKFVVVWEKEKGVKSPTIKVSGMVVGSNNQPLIGATVKGKNITVVSDERGYFELNAEQGSVLIVSYVGFQQREYKITDESKITINLLPVNSSMDTTEIVIKGNTGYQVIDKEHPGSFAVVNNELLNRRVGSNILDRLDGITNSLRFDKREGRQAPIQIRGLSTLGNGTSTDPLIVLDNFPYQGDINTINPNDVESVTILKDAAAASIWGATAGNGVIVITTKKGKYNQAPQISFSSNATYLSKPDLFKLDQISTSEYIDVEKFLFERGHYDSDINNTVTYPAITPVVKLLNQQRNDPSSSAEAPINALRNQDVRNDFMKYIYRRALNQQYALSVNGGSSTIKYYLSSGFDQVQQNLVENQTQRISFLSGISFQVSPKLLLEPSIRYTLSNSQNNNNNLNYESSLFGGNNGGTASKRIFPYAQLADASGKPLSYNRYFNDEFNAMTANDGLLNWQFSPLDELKNADNRGKSQDVQLNLNAKYELFNGLDIALNYQYTSYFTRQKNYYNTNTFFTRDIINQFTQMMPDGITYIVPNNGILDKTDDQASSNSIRALLNLNKSWNIKHNLTAIAGAELREAKTDRNGYRTYGYDDNLLTTANIDFVNRYPTYRDVYGSRYIYNPLTFSGKNNRFVSLFANASYNLDNKYTLYGSMRTDASNIYGVKTNNKWKPLWSAGAAWKISDETFYQSDILPYLNARINYGVQGNTDFSNSAFTTIRYDGQLTIDGYPQAIIDKQPNPGLRWEKVGMFNIGLDFGFKGNVVSGSIEYYQKKSTDVLGFEQPDQTTGILSPLIRNSANIEGRGLDLQLNIKKNIGILNWNSAVNLNFVKNKVTRYLLPIAPAVNNYVGVDGRIMPIAGYDPYLVVSYKWMGLDPLTGDPQGYLNGQISKNYVAISSSAPFSESVVIHGSGNPSWFGNFLNTFFYQKIALSFNITYEAGYYFFRKGLDYYTLFNKGYAVKEFSSRWRNPGDELTTSVPSMIYPLDNNAAARNSFYRSSENLVDKGDHIRLNDIRLAYELKLSKNKQVKGIRLYANIDKLNILIWRANKNSIDPNYLNGLKPPKEVSAGLSLTF